MANNQRTAREVTRVTFDLTKDEYAALFELKDLMKHSSVKQTFLCMLKFTAFVVRKIKAGDTLSLKSADGVSRCLIILDLD